MDTSTGAIGFFDSGVGGITVLQHAMTVMPYENFIYYADIANVPYGTKTAEEIYPLVEHAADILLQEGVKAIVLACNTATSAAATKLRIKYSIPIIGMEPAIKPAVLNSDPRKVLVLATELTLREKKFIELINQLDAHDRIDGLAAGELVNFAEEFDFDSYKLQSYLKTLFKQVDIQSYHSIVLGCTHFSYFLKNIKSILPAHIHILDGIKGTVKELQRKINSVEKSHLGKLECILSGTKVDPDVIQPYLNLLRRDGQSIKTIISGS